jgi:hypothetical protein
MLNLTTIKKIAYIYLLIPFILFTMGWLNWIAAVFVCLIIVAGFVSIWHTLPSKELFEFRKADFIVMFVVLGVWIFLSGVGGYTFQNWDHHSRNAVFRDLINYPWPVVYHFQPGVSVQFGIPSTLIMSYYFGFWLPSALVGKLLGWGAANFSLFLWTYFGIAMAVILTATKLKISFLKTALLIIFFSGMDFIGVILFKNIRGYTYPLLWPPIQHLEWWAGWYQYSSFTTDLYWTYNQFVPALLIMALFVSSSNGRALILLEGVCFFLAPFPALGMSPFIAGSILSEALVLLRNNLNRRWLISLVRHFLAFENFAGLVLGGVSTLFFMTNLSVQTRSLGLPTPIGYYIVFIFLEGILIWLALLPANKADWMWYVAGAVLILAPFVNLGGNWDFMARTTIPALYILMLGCGRFLVVSKNATIKVSLALMILVGALTPVYEINRSIVRTARYCDLQFLSAITFDQYFEHPPVANVDFVPEFDHPQTLVADDWVSLSIPRTGEWNTKVGALFNPIFSFLWKSNLIFR